MDVNNEELNLDVRSSGMVCSIWWYCLSVYWHFGAASRSCLQGSRSWKRMSDILWRLLYVTSGNV